MAKCTVIGSGPSGVHFALTALEMGHHVEMIDVGHSAPENINPQDTFVDLKNNLADPSNYFLGSKNEGVLLPGKQEEFYGIPPSKEYALKTVPQLALDVDGFEPMFSFARGGLAQMWTAGCYPFNDDELEQFPFNSEDFRHYYSRISERIGISGDTDDLFKFFPHHEYLQKPLRLDKHSELLYSRYKQNKDYFHQKLGCYIGRARQAVLSNDRGSRKACQYLGRCLWGCPVEAIYTPSITLQKCMEYPNFKYIDNYYVKYFESNDDGLIQAVLAEPVSGGPVKKFTVEKLVLAAGTLGSSKIILESEYRKTGNIIKLTGLMDNRQILVPFLNLRMIGHPYKPDSYQYNQLAMELESDFPQENVHCLITTLKTSMIHPVLEKFPADLRTSLYLMKNIHAALGVLNINFHDNRREENYLSLDVSQDADNPKLVVRYMPPANEDLRINRELKRIKRILRKLGCIVPPGMIYKRPMGASVHYAGTIPMSETAKPWTVSSECVSHDFNNLYIADGSTYPFLPAKNITFTLMANAMRVAELMGDSH